jgi:replicative DNA helicase
MNTNQTQNMGKLPPQAVEVEEIILGALMLERDAIHEVINRLSINDFYRESHQHIYEAILNLFSKHEPIDIKTVTHELKEMGKLEVVGGAYYVVTLTNSINSASNIASHSAIVKEASIKRELINMATVLLQQAYEDTEDVFDLMERTDMALLKIQQGLSTSNIVNIGAPTTIEKLVTEVSDAKEARKTSKLVGLPTGFTKLDRITGGFRPTDLIIIAARPGMGKTALVGSIMKNAACDFDKPIALFSLEMSWNQIGLRILSMTSEVMMENMRNGNVEDYEFEQISHKSNQIAGATMLVDDTPAMSIMQMRSKAIELKRKHDIQLLIVDYIQLARGEQMKGGNREQEIASISRGLKAIAKELKIPVIALSQLSRAVETRGGDKRPMLSDLRESGAIEQDADMVIFLYRPEYYGIQQFDDGSSTAGIGELIIAKHRNGNTDSIEMKFIGKYTKWTDEGMETWETANQEPMQVDNTGFEISLPAKGKLTPLKDIDTPRTPYKED